MVSDEISLNVRVLMSHMSVITLTNTELHSSNESTVRHVNYIPIKLLLCVRDVGDTGRWEGIAVKHHRRKAAHQHPPSTDDVLTLLSLWALISRLLM